MCSRIGRRAGEEIALHCEASRGNPGVAQQRLELELRCEPVAGLARGPHAQCQPGRALRATEVGTFQVPSTTDRAGWPVCFWAEKVEQPTTVPLNLFPDKGSDEASHSIC